MSHRARLDTVCPNNHDLTVHFSREEFEKALASDTLILHCNTCDANWPPTADQIAKLRAELKEN
jgi:hypothetical protein